MWPFKRSTRNRQRDLLLEDVDLETFAPFTEVDRYLLVFPVAVGFHYVMMLVYEADTGERVHVAHSPGFHRGGGMVNFIEWIATGVRRRDSRAIALLASWPTDVDELLDDDALTRSHFTANPTGVASPSTTVLVGETGGVENVLTREQECLYAEPSFFPRRSAAEWSRILGTTVVRFSTTEWEAAADEIDSDRSIRDETEHESDQRMAVQTAFFKEMGLG